MATKKITELVELISAASGDVLPIVDISDDITKKIQVSNFPISTAAQTAIDAKQDTLVSGTNIKTINSTSLLGSGDVAVQQTLVSGTNIKTLNSESLLGSGNIEITASPAGVAGAIQFSDGSAFASDASNLFWDDTNNRLGIGINTPTARLQVKGSGTTFATTSLLVQNSASTDVFKVTDDGSATANSFKTNALNINSNQIFSSSGIKLRNISSSNGGTAVSTADAAPSNTMLYVKGFGSTSATTALLVQNSAGTQSLKLGDGGSLQIGLTSGTNWTFNTNILSSNQYAYIAGSNGSVLTNGNFSGGVYGNDNGGKVADSGISISQVASAVLEVSSTTRGFLPPRMTTTQKNAISSPASGLMVYDTDTNKLCCYNGTSWNDLF